MKRRKTNHQRGPALHINANSPVILSRRSAAKELKLRGTSHKRRILRSFAVYAAQDDGTTTIAW